MTSQTLSKGILRAVGIITAIILTCLFLNKIKPVLSYLAFAAVIALIGRPIVYFLRRKLKMPNTLAVVITMLILFGILLGIISMFVPLVAEQGKNLALLNIHALRENLSQLFEQIVQYFGTTGQRLVEMVQGSAIEEQALSKLDMSFIPEFLNSFVSTLSSFSIGLFSVLFISFFFLKDSKLLLHSILAFVPDNKEAGAVKSMNKINNLLSRYFVGLLLQMLILFLIYWVTLLIAGVDNALIIAFLCAIFNLIPYVGPLIAATLMVLLTMTSFLGQDFSSVILPKTAFVLVGFLFGQLVDNFFSQPIIFSNSVKSHPLEIFLVILISGLLFGVTGMIVAVPAYTVIKVILKEFFADNKVVRSLTRDL